MKTSIIKAVVATVVLLAVVSFANAKSNPIDVAVERSLAQNNITPSSLCEDDIFLRRTYLILTGKIPTIEQCEAFLKSKSSKKRTELIDQLLASEEFVDFQVLKWGDLLKVKSEFPSNLWPNGVQAYNRWLREKIRTNTPYDQFVAQLLSGTGSNFRHPQINFYRAFVTREPKIIADNVELLFLGRRESQPQARNFFTQLRYKTTKEWKEEIVYVDLDTDPTATSFKMDDGVEVTLTKGADFRDPYIEWLTSRSNKQFARAYANRVWYWLMGHGIVHEPDDFKADNKPSNPELLELLTKKVVELNFDTRKIMRFILTSKTYQRSSLSNASNRADVALFSHYPTTRLSAEAIIDGISIITGINDRYVSRVPEPYSYYPSNLLSWQIGDATVSSPQLDLFGRPSRDYSLESDRSNSLNNKQTLYLLNSTTIVTKIQSSNKIRALVESCSSREEVIDKVYLMMVARYPDQEDLAFVNRMIGAKLPNRMVANNLVWSLLNSTEFIFNH